MQAETPSQCPHLLPQEALASAFQVCPGFQPLLQPQIQMCVFLPKTAFQGSQHQLGHVWEIPYVLLDPRLQND